MTDYAKIQNYAAKDSGTLDANRLITGTGIDNELNAISVAVATKANTLSPTLTTPSIGAATGTSLVLTGGSSASQYVSTVAIGTPPLVVTSTTEVANLKVASATLATTATNTGGKTTIASSTTPDIFSTTVGTIVDYTGTATCTGFIAAPQAGATKTLICAGACIFTAGANLIIDGVASASSITMAVNDEVHVVALTTTQFLLTTRKAFSSIISGAITATTIASSGSILSSSPTLGIGYSTGAGGYVVQLTSNVTNVTLNTISGQILYYGGSVTAGSYYVFNISNSLVTTDDIIIGSGTFQFDCTTNGTIIVRRLASGTGSEPTRLINFAIFKSAKS